MMEQKSVHPSHNYANEAYRCWKCQVKIDHPKALTQCMKVEVMRVKLTEKELVALMEKHIQNCSDDIDAGKGTMYDLGWKNSMVFLRKIVVEGEERVTESPQ